MEEFDFIRSIKPDFYRQSSVVKGIGDDAAIVRHTNKDIITTVDTMVENVHFSSKTTEPFHIGYRALAANISDIAAMGGMPTSYVVSIAIPDSWSADELQEIYHGMDDLAKVFNMDLIGGDTVSGEQLVLSITVLGTVLKGKARYRSDAQEHDIIFVTGTLGDAACGLHILLNASQTDREKYRYFIDRHRMPMPRVSFINQCEAIKRLSLNDISDGIANEANEIAVASDKTLLIEYNKVPSHPQLSNFSSEQQFNWMLSGGEDFELIGTVSEKDWEQLETIAMKTNTKISAIGTVRNDLKKNGTVWLQHNHESNRLKKSGYTHLRR
ncbi:thiamine-phosphate kinase [Gracilibacillus salitolerans]|uniref:Thiamine-monophosphate kinase n=1 Tax=Gracilibacillus salitolerans TaxID=2663022 RepID=A0A5Q2TG63_9BACI|nr:thiamine-phosphate kinase [Gracilibacillus salitolerans]QGH33132.1 thiamine-phosphate kinase [Gracilibacillus salitolerans]